ncbi:hypothetical protein KFE96_00480 [Kordiimonas sp. SCSIO 12603]|uniref:hypothetical protein n=1 Tax=Kordiimonas sp. SCSIO 12603 TaxID=2829596 RepID=UPI0021022CD6|nr:hypothetical protein [Kordiimonas sp. SCSIO 12603]UTW58819.1 hypothetical protein KFE96_00480 [Kordiimonas sp. SCSIO 12603]
MKIEEMKIDEMSKVVGGCPHGLVDGSSYANVGCITPEQLADLIAGLGNADSNPPHAPDFNTDNIGSGGPGIDNVLP